jgi:mono/diheme cytochrome c family protein
MGPRHSSRAILLTVASLVLAFASAPRAHDITTKVTWNREIARIVYARCATCHRPGGTAFSLIDYQQASPWAVAIKDTVLQRQMPPWGAVKGFGEFRNDQALSQEEIDLITNWVDGGVPEGNPDNLPLHPRVVPLQAVAPRTGELIAAGDYTFARPFTMDGFRVLDVAKNGSAKITIAFPDGRIAPLVWLHDYSAQRAHPFLLRTPMTVPAGASLHGVPSGTRLVLFPPVTSER